LAARFQLDFRMRTTSFRRYHAREVKRYSGLFQWRRDRTNPHSCKRVTDRRRNRSRRPILFRNSLFDRRKRLLKF
jgi:hypothetical protein